MSCNLIEYDSPYLAPITPSESNRANIEAAIDSATKAMENYLWRTIGKTQHDEITNVAQFGRVFLKNFPVATISRFQNGTDEAIKIHNTSGSVSHAIYYLTATALELSYIESGTNTTVSLTFAGNTTVAAMVDAINGVGHGFVAEVMGDYANYPASDLVQNRRGSAKALNTIQIWVESDEQFNVNAGPGIIETATPDGCQCRIVYTAGFEEIPSDLQRVCGEIVCNMLDPKYGALQSEMIDRYQYTLATADAALGRLPINSKTILASYRNRGV